MTQQSARRLAALEKRKKEESLLSRNTKNSWLGFSELEGSSAKAQWTISATNSAVPFQLRHLSDQRLVVKSFPEEPLNVFRVDTVKCFSILPPLKFTP
uniref:Uncharacterized protein n=1 Tax=Fundulus heteroclitus TaxID=8078 RepID=A0A146PS10_FUNHE